MKCTAFDRFKKRLQIEVLDGAEETVITQTVGGRDYNVTFILQFYDMKQKPIYVEKKREPADGQKDKND
jgi:hypothetical protein